MTAAPSGRQVLVTRSPEETFALGRRFGAGCRGGETFALVGDLGAGKTVFAKGVAAGLGCDPDAVTSPTFLGLAVHRGRGRLVFAHADAYRVEDAGAFARDGWEDLADAVRLVEWADRVPGIVPPDAVRIRMTALPDGTRRIEMEGAGTLPAEKVDA